MRASPPVAFFAFNRPQHAESTLRALASNPEAESTEVHAFVDGPRSPADHARVDEVRQVVGAARGFGALHLHCSDTNLGLYRSITEGVAKVLDAHDTVIVVEDDVQVATCFLAYMGDALERYRLAPAVGSIHAYAPPIHGLPDYYFLRGGDCWGWATWRDRWRLFESDPRALLRELVHADALGEFMETHGAQSLLQLVRRAQGRNRSWAIQWHASLFRQGRLTLHPGQSFVVNTGNDASGSHAAATAAHSTVLRQAYDGHLPTDVLHDSVVAGKLSESLDRISLRGISPLRPFLRRYAVHSARREARRRTEA